MSRRATWLLRGLIAPALLAGCNGKAPSSSLSQGADQGTGIPGEDAGFPNYTWWQDIQPIVSQKCQLCHSDPPKFTAPRPLVEYRDTQVRTMRGAPVHQEMVQRIFAESRPMPPPSQPRLTAEEKEIIRVWSANGAPEGIRPAIEEDTGVMVGPDGGVAPGDDASQTSPGDAHVTPPEDGGSIDSDGGVMVPDGGMGVPTRAIEVRAVNMGTSNPYDLPIRDTSYQCWSIRVPQGSGNDEFAVRFEHIVGNTTHLHHMLLFRASRGTGNIEPGPFSCTSWPQDWDMISGWAPGRMAELMPPGVGVPIAAGDQLILQVHYDNVRQMGQTDHSGIRVILVEQDNLQPAGIMWAGAVWLSPMNGANVSKQATCDVRHATTIFADFPHMHQLGTRILLELQRGGRGPWEQVVEIPAWDFEDQPNVPIPMQHQQVMPGDKLRTTCWWNTHGRSIGFGESTSDEMCFHFLYHYPVVSGANLYCVRPAL